jgi:predicted DNA-binding transcriptional regulator YafY
VGRVHWWILSQGARIVVQVPIVLKNALKDEISRIYHQYQNKVDEEWT